MFGSNPIDYSSACRPFGDNCGFTFGESSITFMLCDEELAIELGYPIYGSVPEVFTQADGGKKSITAPGPGNYLTLGKALTLAEYLLPKGSQLKDCPMLAHGTGTPLNRVTESHVLNELAKAFNINDWLVTGTKCYVGHTTTAAAADQMSHLLGIFDKNIIPGIRTTPYIASDVHDSNLNILLNDYHLEKTPPMGFINSKAFGGNNATAVVCSPDYTKQLLSKRYTKAKMKAYEQKLEKRLEKQSEYFDQILLETPQSFYKAVPHEFQLDDVSISKTGLQLKEFKHKIPFTISQEYQDLL